MGEIPLNTAVKRMIFEIPLEDFTEKTTRENETSLRGNSLSCGLRKNDGASCITAKAHLFICFIAYLLISLLQRILRKQGMKLTAIKALDNLKRKQMKVNRTISTADSCSK